MIKHTTIINKRYKKDESFRAKWDHLHQKLRCCGASSQGWKDFNTLRHDMKFACVPDSCCIKEEDCPRNCDGNSDGNTLADIWNKSYLRGCMEILKIMYENDLRYGEFLLFLQFIYVPYKT